MEVNVEIEKIPRHIWRERCQEKEEAASFVIDLEEKGLQQRARLCLNSRHPQQERMNEEGN